MRLLNLLMIFAAAVVPAAAHAADFLGEYGGWEVYQADESCYMALEYDGPGDTILAFLKYADGGIFLSASNYNWSAKKDQKYDLTYYLDQVAYSGGNSLGTAELTRKGFLTSFESDFEQHLGAGKSLDIYLGETLVDQLSLAGTASALVKVNSCVRSVQNKLAAAQREKERWEHIPNDPFADEKTRDATLKGSLARSAVPKGSSGSWASANDYPSRALREGHEGTTQFNLTVGVNGRATGCEITTSSGFPELDTATCLNMVRRARFDPALNEDGEPVDGNWESSVNWAIPN